MSTAEFESLLEQYRESLRECRELYTSTGRQFADRYPHLLDRPAHEFVELMEDLHKGLLIKLYITIMESDLRWSAEEKKFAKVLFQHVWGQTFGDAQLREATARVSQDATQLKWESLVRPFVTFAPMRERLAELGTIVLRIANLTAKCDGEVTPGELAQLRNIQASLESVLGGRHERPPPAQFVPAQRSTVEGAQAVQAIQSDANDLRQRYELKTPVPPLAELAPSPEELLADALAQLEALVGLRNIKHEVRTLTNFLKMQRARAEAGLPQTQLSLHMVFEGNPGTGKTSVARIVGKIFGAMGILKRGHLVETDRSGMVAEYAGQTGPKTNKKIDEALDGVLFIDEAYSLVADANEDAYGREAIQTLLKRMEDNRDRLVVILAGYPEPMDKLLKSNPGLSSRFNTTLNFPDYVPSELGQIFEQMCEKNHYVIPAELRCKLLVGAQWLHEHRDEHFGNGRLVRNLFENSIRRLANRIAGVAPITKELLCSLVPSDVELPDVPAKVLESGDSPRMFAVPCPGCQQMSRLSGKSLGRAVQCKKCAHKFIAGWGEPL